MRCSLILTHLQFPADKNRTISPSFLYFRGSEASRDFIGKWYAAANKSTVDEDGVILNRLLRDPDTNAPLNVELLPEVCITQFKVEKDMLWLSYCH